MFKSSIAHKIILIMVILTMVCLCPGYCQAVDLYMYSGEDGSKVLLKLRDSSGNWIELTLVESEYRQGNMIQKILKPMTGYGTFDESILSKIIKATVGIKELEPIPDPMHEFNAIYRFVRYLSDLTKYKYTASFSVLGLSINVYNVNSMLSMLSSQLEPDNILVKHLIAFGYEAENFPTIELLKQIKKGSVSPDLIPLFRTPFETAMKEYAESISEHGYLWLYIVSGIIIIVAIAVIFVILFSFPVMPARRRKIEKHILEQGDSMKRILDKLSDLERQLSSLSENNRAFQQRSSETQREIKAKDEALMAEQRKSKELMEQYKDGLKTVANVLADIFRALEDRVLSLEAELPGYKVSRLLELIGEKIGGKWLEQTKKKVSEILPGSLGVNMRMNLPDTMEALKSIDWADRVHTLLDRFAYALESAKSPDTRYLLEKVGQDIVPAVVEAVDLEKGVNGSTDPSVEANLKELMRLTYVREMDVKTGQIYNPELHELVADNNLSREPDREQRITRVISRGLLLPGARIKKAKVSIQ